MISILPFSILFVIFAGHSEKGVNESKWNMPVWPSSFKTIFIFATRDKSGLKSIPLIYLSAYSLNKPTTFNEGRFFCNSSYCWRIFFNAITKKPPEPQAGSHTVSFILGIIASVAINTISLGVKNSPCSPLKLAPTNVSKATPLISTLVSNNEYFCNSAIAKHKQRSLSCISSFASKILSSWKRCFTFWKRVVMRSLTFFSPFELFCSSGVT